MVWKLTPFLWNFKNWPIGISTSPCLILYNIQSLLSTVMNKLDIFGITLELQDSKLRMRIRNAVPSHSVPAMVD